MRKIRCAIYTRKSSEEGLDQDFNSLDAQRESCAAYIASQKHEGWILLADHYDDGGISGGTMNRPALQRLLHDIDEGLVDQIIVYKIDRLTQSLSDFAKLVDHLDAAEASFVSVTQSFNTSTSMGRLTLNVLLSFAQFEREVTAERIRDKIAASKQKGLWMGGSVPIGYIANGRTLKIHDEEARKIELIYSLYQKHHNIRFVKEELDRMKIYSRERSLSKNRYKSNTENKIQRQCQSNKQENSKPIGSQTSTGKLPFSRGHIHFILTNPIYAGRIRHKDMTFDGQQPRIIDPCLWDQVQAQLQGHARKKRDRKTGRVDGSKLQGKLFDENGASLTPSHSKKGKRRYRYYVSHHLIASTKSANRSNWRLPAKRLEDEILAAITNHLIRNQARILIDNTSVEHIKKLPDKIQEIKTTLCKNKNVQRQTTNSIGFNCIHRIDIKPGSAQIKLNEAEIAIVFSMAPELINDKILTFSVPFQVKKRGVETKFIFCNTTNNHDEILVKNIAQAHYFLDQLKSGKSVQQIVSSYGRKTKIEVTAKRVTLLIKLACLAPDITDMILQGIQPNGLTSARLLKSSLPLAWSDQRKMVVNLS